MDLKILLPLSVFAEIKDVIRIVTETSESSFGLIPQKQDCFAKLVPCIFTCETKSKSIHYFAVDEGVLIKSGDHVLVSVRNAFGV